eukprot:6177976-Pleurochrysis_carterae.AAC.1
MMLSQRLHRRCEPGCEPGHIFALRIGSSPSVWPNERLPYKQLSGEGEVNLQAMSDSRTFQANYGGGS